MNKLKLVFATTNRNKLCEAESLFAGEAIELLLPSSLGIDHDTIEDGDTFEANALKKAKEMCLITGLPSFADDSGLCIDALGGKPGVYSARYAEAGSRKIRVLSEMKDIPDSKRGAHFECAVLCVFPNGDIIKAGGRCYGVISRELHGDGGFGYDPLFYIPEAGKTFAEMTLDEKNKISHRAIAFNEFKYKLTKYLKETGK